MTNTVIKINDLKKHFGKVKAVDGISLDIAEGEIFGMLGPNGAGKTTTISMLATLLKPDAGSASVAGYDVVKRAHEVRKSIGIVFQEPSSDDILTGWENLYLHCLMFGVPLPQINSRIKEVLELIDLYDRRNDIIKKYSGGMRRRLELGRGLLHRPKVLFLDEPTLGLDPQTRVKIWEYINGLAKKEKVTVILTTHYMDEADSLCDRVAIIDYGKVTVIGTPDELKARAKVTNLNDVFMHYTGRDIRDETFTSE
ncbi:MAG: ATP-binding cassette domain-containing protein [bacterium]